jgi:hypothetical protein
MRLLSRPISQILHGIKGTVPLILIYAGIVLALIYTKQARVTMDVDELASQLFENFTDSTVNYCLQNSTVR